MSNTVVMIMLAVVVLIAAVAFIVLSVRKPDTTTRSWNQVLEGNPEEKQSSEDIRSKKIKCQRCGSAAFGILGTEDIYRCQSCGFKSKAPSGTS